ncbi:MAG: ABC transporter permease, partial [Eubacterium sp.]|nr:ABC transporter permease [Eubacterium sp.]
MFRIYGLYIKKMLRTKSALFWNLAFPIILGTLFYFAFSNIYGDQASKAMRIAIVGENAEQHPFTRVLEGLTYDDGSRMMDITFATEEEANRMLDNAGSSEGVAKALFGSSLEKDKEKGEDDRTKRVIGVITLSGAQDVTLTIKENDMYQSILSGIVSAYRQKAAFLADSMEKGGEAYEEAVKVVSEDVEFVISKGMAGENKDPYLAYFYNLIAMMCMLGSILAMDMFISVQPNATNTGLRIGASGVSRLKYEAAIFLAVFTMQMVCTGIALVYILGILKLRFGGELGGILLT